MDAGPLIERILNDEGLTGDLLEAEAEMLNTWLIGRAKSVARSARTMAEAKRQLETICRKAMGIGKVMAAWREHGDAAGVATSNGLKWKPGRDGTETLTGLLGQVE
ncbi:hypothetical protein [Zavarzinella formosa]|uniref:hypothetical protein n=1 Tax=Zavarzinella formosa TaxID=360055 RepID=UPI0003073023|nr:hypothetical protein [Zavarzinella formosa]